MAPTGKAAARLREAMAPMPEGMQCGTIHRWLEASGDGRFRRGPQRLLELSSVVVDEFSMVEIMLLEALLAALPPGVKLFLLGDPGQLPPISGAGVLAPLKAKLVAEAPQYLIELKGSHRFNQTTALGEFVQQLRKGPIDLATQLQQLPETGNLGFYNLNLGWPIELTERLNLHRKQLLIAAENKYYSDQDALNTLLELMLLAPRRKGRHGVDQLNERWLGLDRNNPLAWPVGTPVLINRNNNEKGLSNGDLGLIRSDERGRKVAVIASGDGAQRIPLELLVGVEPALAITVHKSQGSQAKQVIVVINEAEGLDPRLLYTALTRAQDRADLLFSVP
jgi:exodeoxyribonuclease V alpha subunit